ncbi:hypothetical protein PsorP6_008684 [Peronosclerospora sorghi]|uniref:Uncharacterized protein n=1 Tax=Peronosclerospora sorghi TaxID=230839 RepID=A0ACC0VZJ4_9STRA|nr:hypothetical protein PsorP6_008684 [Peronosclerospora sorghi]
MSQRDIDVQDQRDYLTRELTTTELVITQDMSNRNVGSTIRFGSANSSEVKREMRDMSSGGNRYSWITRIASVDACASKVREHWPVLSDFDVSIHYSNIFI